MRLSSVKHSFLWIATEFCLSLPFPFVLITPLNKTEIGWLCYTHWSRGALDNSECGWLWTLIYDRLQREMLFLCPPPCSPILKVYSCSRCTGLAPQMAIHFCLSFLVATHTLPLLLERYLLFKLRVKLFLSPGHYPCFPLLESNVKISVWTDGDILGWIKMATPLGIHFKNIIHFLYQKQYLLKSKGKVISIPIIEDWKNKDS